MSSRWLTFVLIIAFALRAVAVIKMGGDEPSPDARDDYLPMAANLLAGVGFVNGAGEPDSVRGPAFPLFIAAARWVWSDDSNAALKWLQALVDTFTVALVAGIARRAIGPAAGLAAAVLYAVNPMAIYSCIIIGPEILSAFLLTAAVAAYMRGIETKHLVWMAIAGLTIGLTVLSRATPALLVPIWGVWVIVDRIRSSRRSEGNDDCVADPDVAKPTTEGPYSWTAGLRRGLVDAIVLGAFSAAVVLPWTARNWIVFHEFIPVAANGGVNFYAGSSERFWPAPPEHHRQRALRHQELTALGVGPTGEMPVSPGAGDKYQFALGMANYGLAWKESPRALIGYLARKSLRLWYATQSGRMERFVGAVNAGMLFLAIGGLIFAWRSGRFAALAPVILTVVYFPLVLTAMFPLARYVVGFMPCMCVLAAGIVLLSRRRSLKDLEQTEGSPRQMHGNRTAAGHRDKLQPAAARASFDGSKV